MQTTKTNPTLNVVFEKGTGNLLKFNVAVSMKISQLSLKRVFEHLHGH